MTLSFRSEAGAFGILQYFVTIGLLLRPYKCWSRAALRA